MSKSSLGDPTPQSRDFFTLPSVYFAYLFILSTLTCYCFNKAGHSTGSTWWHIFQEPLPVGPIPDHLQRLRDKSPSPIPPSTPLFQVTTAAVKPKLSCASRGCKGRANQKCHKSMCRRDCLRHGGCVLHSLNVCAYHPVAASGDLPNREGLLHVIMMSDA